MNNLIYNKKILFKIFTFLLKHIFNFILKKKNKNILIKLH